MEKVIKRKRIGNLIVELIMCVSTSQITYNIVKYESNHRHRESGEVNVINYGIVNPLEAMARFTDITESLRCPRTVSIEEFMRVAVSIDWETLVVYQSVTGRNNIEQSKIECAEILLCVKYSEILARYNHKEEANELIVAYED